MRHYVVQLHIPSRELARPPPRSPQAVLVATLAALTPVSAKVCDHCPVKYSGVSLCGPGFVCVHDAASDDNDGRCLLVDGQDCGGSTTNDATGKNGVAGATGGGQVCASGVCSNVCDWASLCLETKTTCQSGPTAASHCTQYDAAMAPAKPAQLASATELLPVPGRARLSAAHARDGALPALVACLFLAAAALLVT